jgi:hypothetical protein
MEKVMRGEKLVTLAPAEKEKRDVSHVIIHAYVYIYMYIYIYGNVYASRICKYI